MKLVEQVKDLKHKRLLRLLLRGFSKTEIHNITGWSRVTINKYLKDIRCFLLKKGT